MKKLLIIALVACLSGCTIVERGHKVFCRSYVLGYYDIKGIDLEIASLTGYGVEYWHQGIQLSFEHSSDVAYWSDLGDYESTGALKESYDALCEKHGDMEYNRTEYSYPPPSRDRFRIGVDFVSIDIVSDADFDENHTAGKSLGDIVQFESYSPKSYIDSGYSSLYYSEEYPNSKSEFYPISESVSELTPEQLTLLSGVVGLRFRGAPTLSKTHNFTVTMTADDGRVFSDTIEMTFE